MQWNEQNPVVACARRIVERLQQDGFEAYWVGGCVRDALLGLDPKDIDVATGAPPERVQTLFPRNVAVGAHFGVIRVLDGPIQTEVATFRSDGQYLDGRHPVTVTFSTPAADAARRDFTINALFYDPVRDVLHDFTGGRKDLQDRILRAIGDPAERFREDALRLLRAVRLAVVFHLRIEPRTREALGAMAQAIRLISAERVREELLRIFTGPRPGEGLRLLEQTGLLARVLPEVHAMKGVSQPEAFHPEGDVFTHTALALDALPPNPSPALAFAALLHDVGKPVTYEESDRIRFNQHNEAGAEIADAVCRRLKFSNAGRQQIVEMIARHMDFINIHRMRPATLRRFLALERFEEHLELHRVDCLASHGDLDNYRYCREKMEEFARAGAEPVLPPPLINGDVLIAAGYQPGPRMGAILRALREAQLNGEARTPEEAIAWVRERYPQEIA